MLVDQVDINGKNRHLPREISLLVDGNEKSAEVIVPRAMSKACLPHSLEDSQLGKD